MGNSSSVDEIDVENELGVTAKKYHENSPDLVLNLENPNNVTKYFDFFGEEKKVLGCIDEIPAFLLQNVSLYSEVKCAFNQIRIIPFDLAFHLPHLKYLDLSYNCISSIPNSIQFFLHLSYLNLSHNQISRVPCSMFYMKSLRKLDLSYNVIKNLPDRFDSLCLVKLNIGYNFLKELPRSVGSCRTLEILIVKGNPIEGFSNLADTSSKSILQYLRQESSAEQEAIVDQENYFPRFSCNQVCKYQLQNPEIARAQFIQLQNQVVNTGNKIKVPLLPPLNATKLRPDVLKDKILGIVYGAAIGNALGIATDFMDFDDVLFNYDSQTINFSDIIRDKYRIQWTNGSWTSDFDQLVLLLDSIIQWGGVVDELDFAKRLMDFAHNSHEFQDKNRMAQKVVTHPEFCNDPHGVAAMVNKKGFNCVENFDNSALCRSLVLGIPQFHNLSEVVSNTIRICKSTHNDEVSISTSVTINVLIAILLQDDHQTLEPILLEAPKRHGLQQIHDSKLQSSFVEHLQENNLDDQSTEPLYHPFNTLSMVFAALNSYLHHKLSFEIIMTRILYRGGYSSVTAAACGAVLGCLTGFKTLPSKWVDGLQENKVTELNGRLNSLLDIMGIP